MNIYLAGPDVFFPNAVAIGEAKKQICARYGHQGHNPFDNEIYFSPTPDCGYEICRLNLETIARCDAVVANLTPFRGVSADPGTVFEVGYAVALGKRVYGYSCDPRSYNQRVAADPNVAGLAPDVDRWGDYVENFALADNLMIEGGIRQTDGLFIARAGENLAVFEELISLLPDT